MTAISHHLPQERGSTRALTALSRLVRAALLTGIALPTIEGKPSADLARLWMRTPRLLLRPLTGADRDEFIQVIRRNQAHLERFCPLSKESEGVVTPEAIFERHLAMQTAGDHSGRAWRRLIVSGEGRIIGAVNINDISRGLEHTGEMVAWLDAASTGRGYALEALEAALAHAFEDMPGGLGLHKVIALIAPLNVESDRLVSRLGFERGIGAGPVRLLIGSEVIEHRVHVKYAPIVPTLPGVPSAPEAANPDAARLGGSLVRGLNAMLSLEHMAADAVRAA